MDIKARLRERGIRQKEIADRLDVSEPTVSKWVNGHAVIPTQYLRPMADALAVSVDVLLPAPSNDGRERGSPNG